MKELSRRYAAALYGVYTDDVRLREASEELMSVPELWEALKSPAVRFGEKERVLERVTKLSDAPELLCFFKLLAEKGRIELLPDIVREFYELTLSRHGAAECLVTCAREPDKEIQEKLKTFLCKAHDKSEVRLSFRIEPSVIGGFILNIDGVTYDQSVRGRLRKLNRYLEEVNTYERKT